MEFRNPSRSELAVAVGSWPLAPHRLLLPTAAATAYCILLFSCGAPPTDADRAHQVIDSTRATRHIDSLRTSIMADSLKDGYHAYRDRSGHILMEGDLRDGRRQGIWTSYAPNGRVQSRNEYVDGALNGLSTVFHENGVLYYTGVNRHGKHTGEWRFYGPDGTPARTVHYDTSGTLINDR